MAFAFIIAGIVFCIALTRTPISIDFKNNNFYHICIFVPTLFFGLFAIYEYENHKREVQVNLLCQYNQRYSTDCNIRTMLEWMLKVSISNDKGDIVGVDLSKSYFTPGVNTKELFMRFFEELYLQIEEGNLNAQDVYELFAYYAIKFDKHNEFHKEIVDYTSKEDVEKLPESERNEVNKNWKKFSKFIDKMNEIEGK